MKRLLFLALTGCFGHLETSSNLPAHLKTKLEDPPASLRGTGIADKGEDTGMKGWLGHSAVYMGGAFGTLDRTGGRFALELGATPFELDRFRGPDAPFEAQPTIWWRPSIGVVLYDELQQRRIGAARDGSAVGPLYGEFQLFPWQGSKGFGTFMVGLGGQVSLATADGGPQATVCGGPFIAFLLCVRGSYLANAGSEIGFFLSINALGTLGWAK